MIDPESLREYPPSSPSVESVGDRQLVLYCGDDVPDIGTAAAVVGQDCRLWTVVERHLGARRVETWAPDVPEWLEKGLPVEITDQTAGFDFSPQRPLVASQQPLRPLQPDDDGVPIWPTSCDWTDLDSSRPPVELGVEAVDVMAPLVDGGINLFIDATDGDAVFGVLADKIVRTIGPQRLLVRTSTELFDDAPCRRWRIESGGGTAAEIAALQFTVAVSARLRTQSNSLAIVDLPSPTSPSPKAGRHSNSRAPRGYGTGLAPIVDRLANHLVSTTNARVTTLLRLRVPGSSSGLDTIIDTLSVGDVDATIYVDGDRRFDPRRSRSRAEIDDATRHRRNDFLEALDRASSARDKATIFGDGELTDAERRALDTVDSLCPRIDHSDS